MSVELWKLCGDGGSELRDARIRQQLVTISIIHMGIQNRSVFVNCASSFVAGNEGGEDGRRGLLKCEAW